MSVDSQDDDDADGKTPFFKLEKLTEKILILAFLAFVLAFPLYVIVDREIHQSAGSGAENFDMQDFQNGLTVCCKCKQKNRNSVQICPNCEFNKGNCTKLLNGEM